MAETQELTLEARAAIRDYMLKLVAFPGLAAIIVSFLLGFLIKDIAISKAQNDAIAQTTDEVFELIKNTEAARLNLSTLEASNESISSSVSLAGSELEEVKRRSDNLRQIVTQADTELRELLDDPEKTIAALKLLDQFDNEFDIAERLAQTASVRHFHFELTPEDFEKTKSDNPKYQYPYYSLHAKDKAEVKTLYCWKAELLDDGKAVQSKHTFFKGYVVDRKGKIIDHYPGLGYSGSTLLLRNETGFPDGAKIVVDAVLLLPTE